MGAQEPVDAGEPAGVRVSVGAGEPVLVGVDAGSTHATALAVRPDGRELGRAAGAGANPKRHGLQTAAGVIAEVATAAAQGHAPDLLVVAGAGIDRPENAAALHDALLGRAAARRVIVVNDTLAALRAATPDAVGLVVVAGTGANVIGRGPDGRVTDRGHGVFGGSYVLAALVDRARQRRAAPGRPTRPSPAIAAGARTLMDRAAAGDPLPARIVDRSCVHVSAAVREEVDRLGLGPKPTVVLYGGLLDASPWLEARLRAAIVAGAPGARVERLAREPVEGAALLARDAWAGRPVRWEFVPRR